MRRTGYRVDGSSSRRPWARWLAWPLPVADSLVFTAEALRHLAAEVGSSQIVMGTDHPIPWQDKAVDHILDTPSLTDAERVAMLGETAARLLGITL